MIPVPAGAVKNTRSAVVDPDKPANTGERRMGIIRIYIIPVLAVAVSAIFLFTSFPPFCEAQSAWVGLVPLLLITWYKKPRFSFYCGISAGMIFWLMSIAWLLKLGETGTTMPLAVLAWISLSAYSSLFLGCFMAVVSFVMSLSRRDDSVSSASWKPNLWRLCLVFLVPVVWVCFEYLRCVLFGGFPWNPLGVSQFKNLSVIQVAQWGGVYAVSALIVVMNTALMFTGLRLADVYSRRRSERGPRIELMAGLIVCALCWMYGTRICLNRSVDSADTEVRIALVQPNTPQLKKWDEDFEYNIYERLQKQTELARINKPAMIVWPETAVMRPLNECMVTQGFVRNLADDIPVLAGSLETEEKISGDTSVSICYNSSFLITRDGIRKIYRKQHLVPFGEYVPFENNIAAIGRLVPLGFSCTPGNESTVFRVASGVDSSKRDVPFSVLICFEDTISGLARKSVIAGARFLVNQTNDAWFDGSWAALQHMSHCVFRCVENRVPAVRSANTGVTCFIDRFGAVSTLTGSQGSYGLNIEGFKVSSLIVPGDQMVFSLYTEYGDWLFAIPCVTITLLFMVMMFKQWLLKRLSKEA